MSKRTTLMLSPVALVLLVALVLPVALFAATTPGIEIDGNYVDDDAVDPREDWFPDWPPMSDPIGQEDQTLCATSPSPKNDITNTYAANNADFLFLGMERLANTGQTSFFWNFDVGQDGDSPGDFVFVFCFGSGDTVTDTFVLEYDEVTGQFVRDSTPPDIVFSVNERRELAPFGALDRHGRERKFIDRGKFAEARIDLNDIEGFDICDADAVTLEIETRSSCSLSSQCKDTTGPIDFSFFPVTTDLQLAQPQPCEPVLMATANATDGFPPFTYTWFLNGEDITDRDPSYASSDTIIIPLADDVCGPTEVAVRVEDSKCVVDDAAEIDVNRRPEAAIAQAAVGACDLTLAYDGSASADCNADDSLRYFWDLDGDARPDSTDPSGTFVYPTCGERTVGLLVVDDDDCPSQPATRRVYANEPPRAGLTVEGGDCLEILFATSTVDCDLAQNSDLYTESLDQLLDFGDGSTTTDAAGRHEYPACGTWLLNLTATDANGCTDEVDRSVTIETVFQID